MLPPWLKLLRPHQWTKNFFCLAGLVFGTRLTKSSAIVEAVMVFVLFCAASSAVYILNDIVDVERDRRHPKKRERPLARGLVSINTAWLMAILLGSAVLVGGWFLGVKTWACILLYAINNLLYTFRLKHLPLLDVGSIAIGFVLRLLAGVYAVEESPSAWITLCTFFLALFLGFAKRRTELAGLGETLPDTQRPVLAQYTLPWLDSLVAGAATMTVMSYALFTTISGKNPTLVLTVPIVYYAIMHYKLQLLLAAGTEEPEKMLLKDGVIRLSVLLWLLCYLVIVYGDVRLFH